MRSSESPETMPAPEKRMDTLLDGRLKLLQPKQGYRFSVDALLLAEFVSVKPGEVLVDLGTGCGVIPLVLLLTRPLRQAVGLEIQRELVNYACGNASMNGVSESMKVVQGDIRHPPFVPRLANIAICNPPYRSFSSGRINPNTSRAIARHEILASIEDILTTTRYLLKKKGRLVIIYPAERLTDLLARARNHGLEPKRLQIVYPDLDSNSKLVLVEALLGGNPGLQILPPILGQGKYSLTVPV